MLVFSAIVVLNTGLAVCQNHDVTSKPVEISEDDNWQFVLEPSGKLWVWQYLESQRTVHWDYGAHIQMEIARGRKNRVWFGGQYRVAAAYMEEQSVTPFDPVHIDSYQLLTWRYAFQPRKKAFLYTRRFCFHEIDVHNPTGIWMTQMAIGAGTFAPIEKAELLSEILKSQNPEGNVYISMGPFIHGGYQDILGESPAYQWEGNFLKMISWPVSKMLILEAEFEWYHLWLLKTHPEPHRDRVKFRISANFHKRSGGFTFIISRNLHDDYPIRRNPVGWLFGLEHYF